MDPKAQARAIAAGHMTAQGISRRARAELCKGCGRALMRGLDAERCASDVRVDPHPLSALGELQALVDGVRTFELHWRGRYEIDYRDDFSIAGRTPGSLHNVDVVAEHKCGRTQVHTLVSAIALGHKETRQGDAAPF